MKKIIVPAIACLFAIGSLNATTLTLENNIIGKVVNNEVSSFCKLIQKGNIEAVKAMIESGEDINKKSKGLTPLMFAARHNRADIAKLLIKNGANVKVKSDRDKITALAMAKRFKAEEVVKVLKATAKK